MQEDLPIDKLRQLIDECDIELVDLINKRAEYARRIGAIKRQEGASVYAPAREKAVYDKVAKLNKGPLSEKTFQAIYREIMSGTISLEGATRIAFLGPEGTFSHMAALQKFGRSMEYVPCREIRDVFLAVARDHADYGVVPLENSTEGAITQTNDMFMDTNLRICSEIYLEIHQNLLAKCSLSEIKKIASHPQPLAQCRNWLSSNTSHVDLVETVSTTVAAKLASEEEGTAAIASEAAAKIYNLQVIESCIEDRPDNITRFAVLGHSCGTPSANDKTTIMFSLSHKAGSLADTLNVFKSRGINMCRIESRPCRKRTWEYTFFIDIEGHEEDANVKEALDELRPGTHDMIILGSYPRFVREKNINKNGEEVL